VRIWARISCRAARSPGPAPNDVSLRVDFTRNGHRALPRRATTTDRCGEGPQHRRAAARGQRHDHHRGSGDGSDIVRRIVRTSPRPKDGQTGGNVIPEAAPGRRSVAGRQRVDPWPTACSRRRSTARFTASGLIYRRGSRSPNGTFGLIYANTAAGPALDRLAPGCTDQSLFDGRRHPGAAGQLRATIVISTTGRYGNDLAFGQEPGKKTRSGRAPANDIRREGRAPGADLNYGGPRPGTT